MQVAIELNNRGYSYTRNLQPLPAPGTVVVEFLALGKWYTLRDEDGSGELVGHGTGQVNFSTGSISITLQELPDVGSAVLIYWGTPVHYMDRAGYQVPFPIPSLTFELEHGGIVPQSVLIKWMSGGVEVTATDDGKGVITGNAIGRMVYGWQDVTLGDRKGRVWVEFADGYWPDANSLVVVDYEYGASQSETFNPTKDGAGFVSFTLPNAPIKPGSVSFEWSVYRKDYAKKGGTYQFQLALGDGEITYQTYEESQDNSTTVSYRAYDDGVGGIQAFDGTINYENGAVTLKVEAVNEVQEFERTSGDSATTWNNKTVTDEFTSGSAIIARWQPQIIASTAGSVQRNPNPLTVSLLPMIQDMVVPTTLRFTFRGSTYEDRDGSLYRDVDPNTGAGFLSGSIDYTKAEVVLEDWGDSGSNSISITSLVTVFGNWTIYDAFFRTPGSPVKVGELSLLATTADGVLLDGQAQFDGTIASTSLDGLIDYILEFFSIGDELEDSIGPIGKIARGASELVGGDGDEDAGGSGDGSAGGSAGGSDEGDAPNVPGVPGA
jgi:hypothetical protein